MSACSASSPELRRLEEDLALVGRVLERLEPVGEGVEAERVGDERRRVDPAGREHRDGVREVVGAVIEDELGEQLLGERCQRHDRVGTHAHTHDRDPTVDRGDVGGVLDHAGDPDALDHDARPRPRDPLERRRDVFGGRVDRRRGTELLGERAAVIDGITHHHLTRAEVARPERDRDSDRTGSDDEHRLAPLHGGAVERMVRNCERLDQRAVPIVDAVGEPERAPARHGHVLGERALALQAQLLRLRALRRRTGDAHLAVPTPDQWEPGDPLADSERLVDARSDLHDLAGELVSEHQAGRVERVGEVQVGSAHAARRHAEEYLPRPDDGIGNVGDHEGLTHGSGDGSTHAESVRRRSRPSPGIRGGLRSRRETAAVTSTDASAIDPDQDRREAKLHTWERRTQPLIVIAAILPLVADIGEVPTDFKAWALEMACWAMFLVDLVVHLRLRKHYLRTRSGIIDLAIVILTFPWSILVGTSAARLFALFRLARVARIVAVANHSHLVRRTVNRLGRPFLYVVLATLTCSFIVWRSEDGAHGFETFPDALWWGVVTVTTVGYGDLVPTTTVGQVTATVLMFTGVALLGTVAATLASMFRLEDMSISGASATPAKLTAEADDLKELRAEIRELRDLVSRLAPLEPGGEGQTPTSQS